MAHFPPASQRPQGSEEPQSRQGQSAVLSNVPLPTTLEAPEFASPGVFFLGAQDGGRGPLAL